MSAERPDNTKRIFNAAAGIQDAVEQAAYLDQACGENQSLRAEIEDLLRRDRNAGSFLDAPAAYIAATIDVQCYLDDEPVEACPPSTIY